MGAGVSAPSEEVAARLSATLDDRCAEAARLIQQADIFLLCTGAGFSADSGLAVYADVAKVPAYAQRNLEYHDICEPKWLIDEPELFWGFWGQCYNDYRGTPPHEGYEIIDKWADNLFRKSTTADCIRKSMPLDDTDSDPGTIAHHITMENDAVSPYIVVDQPGAFFVFTSNVDAHHFDWFRAEEIRECHGNTELYQCATPRRCSKAIWRAPRDFRFDVDQTTMLAPAQSTQASRASSIEKVTSAQNGNDEFLPRIGHVAGGGRPTSLRHMPGPPPTASEAGFAGNHPTCPFCGNAARPAILMFGDRDWEDVPAQRSRFERWTSVVEEQIKTHHQIAVEKQGDKEPLRVVIMEIGAGANVPTVRRTSEAQLDTFKDAGADVRLVRMNPCLPLGDDEDYAPGGKHENLVLSMMGGGLDLLKRVNAAMPAS